MIRVDVRQTWVFRLHVTPKLRNKPFFALRHYWALVGFVGVVKPCLYGFGQQTQHGKHPRNPMHIPKPVMKPLYRPKQHASLGSCANTFNANIICILQLLLAVANEEGFLLQQHRLRNWIRDLWLCDKRDRRLFSWLKKPFWMRLAQHEILRIVQPTE